MLVPLFLALMPVTIPLKCDVLIAGGSTAALASALTAATISSANTTVCLTEPTDWLGGQLNFNPAIDYGFMPKTPSKEWRSMVTAVTNDHSACWVSKSCYLPSRINSWINLRLKALPNLKVLFRTVVRSAVKDTATGKQK